ncbi:YhjD/YihY/BrkB family envelope integrity protein [Chelativorans sp. AA-79]|uniref:YihY/virulence factor BrkB family protein n=1 Tax=Chelativorans sp. AA-79 TaxID=3028735 RepID=UPI0023F6BD0D|nr:YhjD/YihY/BrkB family envelope integrity protein [Chelativorans sp. AA-79]WEX11815.1 YhjD/YihY/BrkB family envelope integrity protein [Chelativorans sp. AA-79]
MGFLLLVSLIVDAGLAAASDYLLGAFPGARLLWIAINFALGLFFAVLLFGLIFAILPNAEPTRAEVIIDALVSGILFTVGKFVIGIAIARSGATSAYGASASIMTIMLWVYYSSQILLFGAEFGRAYQRWRNR